MGAASIRWPGRNRIPALENGDLLTREEFERRYDAMSGLKKAELLEGKVHMPSPVRFVQHGEQDHDLALWLGFYRLHTPGVRSGTNSSIRLSPRDEPQPDGIMIIDPVCGGQAKIDKEGYIVGSPELIAEVAASSVSYDLNTKLAVFQWHKVKEYLVWRVFDQQVDWFAPQKSLYRRLKPDQAGMLKSKVFPGLWLDPKALIARDLARVLRVLQEGLASREHQAFVERLRKVAKVKRRKKS